MIYVVLLKLVRCVLGRRLLIRLAVCSSRAVSRLRLVGNLSCGLRGSDLILLSRRLLLWMCCSFSPNSLLLT